MGKLHAIEPIQLVSEKCTNRGRGEIVEENSSIVSIGKKIYNPVFEIRDLGETSFFPPLLLTCSIDKSKNIKSVKLSFGIKEDQRLLGYSMNVFVYLDAEKVSNSNISYGELKTVLLDVSKSSNIAIEIHTLDLPNKIRSRGGIVTFTEASLFPVPVQHLESPSSESRQVNNQDQQSNYILEQSSWGKNTEERPQQPSTSNDNSDSDNDNSNQESSPNLNEIINDVENIIDLF
ncbi:MAG: hypothetical protein AAGE84_27855 [Cyanobacteria bacterium P01_G01_bin.39]